jgi:hypothetical protein
MAAPTASRTPNWHRAIIAQLRVRMEGWRQRRLGRTEKWKNLLERVKSLLTRIGLLMEGPWQPLDKFQTEPRGSITVPPNLVAGQESSRRGFPFHRTSGTGLFHGM